MDRSARVIEGDSVARNARRLLSHVETSARIDRRRAARRRSRKGARRARLGKELQGRVPQVCLDLFARQYALEMVNLLLRVDQRLNEEKQKISALDFDDLELRTLAAGASGSDRAHV